MNNTSEKSKNVTLAMKSIMGLKDQCLQAWDESNQTEFSSEYNQINNIVICGMGGSSLPAHIIKSAFKLKVSLTVIEDYEMPSWAESNTLVLLSSYSGNTEEILSCAKQALDQGCLITGVTGGGKLKKFLSSNNYPSYVFDPKHNVSGLPRFGIGYGLFGQLGILNKLNLVAETNKEVVEKQINESFAYLLSHKDEKMGFAANLAKEIKGKIQVIFSAGHLKGNGKTFSSQINETSKTLSFWSELPNANHNLVEGFKGPVAPLVTVFIESKHYLARIQQRFKITRTVLEKNGFKSYEYVANSETLLQEILEVLFFSSIFSVALAIENNVDPFAIHEVDFIKKHLAAN